MIATYIEKLATDALIERLESPKFKRTVDAAIRQQLRCSIYSDRHRPLSEIGFDWAMGFELQHLCPAMTINEARQMMREFLRFAGLRFGSDEHDWTLSGASALAEECVNDF